MVRVSFEVQHGWVQAVKRRKSNKQDGFIVLTTRC